MTRSPITQLGVPVMPSCPADFRLAMIAASSSGAAAADSVTPLRWATAAIVASLTGPAA